MPPKKIKKLVRRTFDGFGILNAFGEFWTPKTFETEQAAHNYIRNWELEYSSLPNHTVVPVLITIIKKQKR